MAEFKNPSADEIQRVLHSPFDIKTHQETFICYLEVIIHSDGTIEYAVPSHVMKLREIYGKSSDEVFEEFYQSKSYMDPTEWLCEKTGCISVWYQGYMGKANEKQLETLRLLKEKSLYKGEIEK